MSKKVGEIDIKAIYIIVDPQNRVLDEYGFFFDITKAVSVCNHAKEEKAKENRDALQKTMDQEYTDRMDFLKVARAAKEVGYNAKNRLVGNISFEIMGDYYTGGKLIRMIPYQPFDIDRLHYLFNGWFRSSAMTGSISIEITLDNMEKLLAKEFKPQQAPPISRFYDFYEVVRLIDYESMADLKGE